MSLIGLSACSVGAVQPASLSYNGSQPFPAVVGRPIALTPVVQPAAAKHFEVYPRLPPGLSLAPTTGVISGTPARASEPATYVIHATGAGAHAEFRLVLSVTEPPSRLSYPNPVYATVGAPLDPVRPDISGSVDRYSVAPDLPAGMMIDAASGFITGTPRAVASPAPYTITASSLAGNARFVLSLSVAPHSRCDREAAREGRNNHQPFNGMPKPNE